MSARILALGGAEFDLRPENVALREFLLAELGRAEPRICLLPTAGGDAEAQIASFHSAFGRMAARTSHVSLFRLGDRPVALREHLLGQDAVFIGGGSLVNLIALWAAHELDLILQEALAAGVYMAGFSAGAMCWFEGGITRSHGFPSRAEGMGVLAGTACPHYDTDPDRASAYRDAIAAGLPGGYGLDDHAGVVIEDGRLREAVSGRPGAGVVRISARGGDAVTEQIPARALPVPEIWAEREDLDEFRQVARIRERSNGSRAHGSSRHRSAL